jgi:integrase
MVSRLSALKVSRLKEPGMYADGNGLYLQVTGPGAKSWVFRYSLRRRPREMGLGSLRKTSLEDARKKAREFGALRDQGIDPIDAKVEAEQNRRLDRAKALTFAKAAEAYIAAQRESWRNAKHAAQWKRTLETYAYPEIGHLSVQAIDTALVHKVLEPIWTKKPETASRVRGRIESVLDWATVRGFRKGENPARWRGHLEKALPARWKLRPVKHHAALPYPEMPAFVSALRAQPGIAAQALEFTILTAGRTSEIINAARTEFDLSGKLWIIPARRMKGGQEHRVPLSARAIEILEQAMPNALAIGDFVFSGGGRQGRLSNMAMIALLRRMGRGDLTVHGMRSTFRDWAAERTNFPREVCEAALAHAVDNKVEAAYRRGDLLDKRRRLMDAWAEFCSKAAPVTGDVVPMRPSA